VELKHDVSVRDDFPVRDYGDSEDRQCADRCESLWGM